MPAGLAATEISGIIDCRIEFVPPAQKETGTKQ
jgi:hypothetical protein